MATRTVRVILEGTATGLNRAFETAGQAADRAADRIDRFESSIDKHQQSMDRAGTNLTAFGAATIAALTGSAAAAVSWESSFAGVKKTVDDSAAGYAELSGELRGMAKELPASHSAIAGVAEAAGQLGIQRENITGFTRTMIDLGETTNLSADEAATALARFSNIMGTSQSEMSNLGSAVVDLGNNYATTEREIVEMGLRLAGAGRQAKLSEGDVLGLATALSSVGIEAEAGGTAFSRVIIEMGTAVDTQGEKLRTFAEVSGMSAEEFSTAWRDNAGEAIAAFIGGLGEMEASGQSVQPVLDELGMTDIRVGDALRRASGASEIFTEAMRTGNDAYRENTALAAEAEQRYATTASQLSVLKNNVDAAAISLGEVFLPVINTLADGGADFASWLSDLPGPLQAIAGWGAAAAGGMSLLVGGTLLALPRLVETGRALKDLGILGPRTVGALKGVSGFLLGPWGLALGGAVTVLGLFAIEQARAKREAEGLRATLDEQTGAVTENTRAFQSKLLQDDGWLDKYAKWGGDIADLTGYINGEADARERVSEVLATQNRAMIDAGNVNEVYGTEAAQLREVLDGMTGTLEEQSAKTLQLAEAQGDGARSAQALSTESARLNAQAEAYLASQEGVNAALQEWLPASEQAARNGEDAAAAYAEWATEMAGFSGSFVSASDALSTVNTATQEWAQAQADATDTAEDSWEDFWDGQSVSVDEWLTELERMAQAQADWETNMVALAGRVSQPVIDELARLGPEGAPLVAELVDASDAELARLEAVMGEGARAGTAAYADAMADAGPIIRAAAHMWGQDIADQIAADLAAGRTTAAEVVAAYDLATTIDLLADPANFDQTLALSLALGNDSFTTPDVEGDNSGFMQALNTSLALGNDSEAISDILGDPQGFMGQLYLALGKADDSEATADILGNANPARGELASFLWKAGQSAATVSIYARLMTNVQSMVSAATAGVRASLGMWPGRADGGPIELASGGPVRGPGGPRDDLVPAYNTMTGQAYRLSNDEHVLTAAEVFALGGHGEVYRMRRAMLDGSIRYDIGGAVGAPRLSREAARYTTPAPVYASAGAPDFSALSAAADKIMVAAASIPDRIEVPVRVGSREVARATREGEQSWGARSTWGHETTTLPGGGRL